MKCAHVGFGVEYAISTSTTFQNCNKPPISTRKAYFWIPVLSLVRVCILCTIDISCLNYIYLSHKKHGYSLVTLGVLCYSCMKYLTLFCCLKEYQSNHGLVILGLCHNVYGY